MKNAISRFGKFLSGMVMPNIGAFIAWGFLTALFIEKGWFPNEQLSSMVSPMLSYLLPILIAKCRENICKCCGQKGINI